MTPTSRPEGAADPRVELKARFDCAETQARQILSEIMALAADFERATNAAGREKAAAAIVERFGNHRAPLPLVPMVPRASLVEYIEYGIALTKYCMKRFGWDGKTDDDDYTLERFNGISERARAALAEPPPSTEPKGALREAATLALVALNNLRVGRCSSPGVEMGHGRHDFTEGPIYYDKRTWDEALAAEKVLRAALSALSRREEAYHPWRPTKEELAAKVIGIRLVSAEGAISCDHGLALKQPCEHCAALSVPASSERAKEQCPTCQGSGKYYEDHGAPYPPEVLGCPDCRGTGYLSGITQQAKP